MKTLLLLVVLMMAGCGRGKKVLEGSPVERGTDAYCVMIKP